jgi:hypothetical protein
MPSGFMPVVIDLQPSMKVTIPWGKPSGIRFMPSGFTLLPGLQMNGTVREGLLSAPRLRAQVTKLTVDFTAVLRAS